MHHTLARNVFSLLDFSIVICVHSTLNNSSIQVPFACSSFYLILWNKVSSVDSTNLFSLAWYREAVILLIFNLSKNIVTFVPMLNLIVAFYFLSYRKPTNSIIPNNIDHLTLLDIFVNLTNHMIPNEINHLKLPDMFVSSTNYI